MAHARPQRQHRRARATCATTSLVTGAYWADTLTDGAIRMLVLFYFYELWLHAVPGRDRCSSSTRSSASSPTSSAAGSRARLGLKTTLFAGLARSSSRSAMLASRPRRWLTVPYVMVAQALSGIAKDLTKMSSKSAVKLVVPDDCARRAVQVGRDPDRLEERAEGRRLLRRRAAADLVGFRRRCWSWPGWSLTALVAAALLMRGDLGTHQHEGEVPPDVLEQPRGQPARRRARVPVRARATSGSSSACRCSSTPCSAGTSGRSAASWRSG